MSIFMVDIAIINSHEVPGLSWWLDKVGGYYRNCSYSKLSNILIVTQNPPGQWVIRDSWQENILALVCNKVYIYHIYNHQTRLREMTTMSSSWQMRWSKWYGTVVFIGFSITHIFLLASCHAIHFMLHVSKC